MTRIATLAVLLLALPNLSAQPNRKLPADTKSETNLAYGEHERQKLDLFIPKSETPLPLIIWIHGGAWQNGSKDGNNPAMSFLAKGYAVASINYRLSQHAIYPAQIQDCKAAVRYLRANAKKFNLKPDAFGVWGASAGGHLVALLGTTIGNQELEGDGKHLDVSSKVQAVCDWFGPTDLLTMNKQATIKGPIDHDSPKSPESKLIGGPVQENKEKTLKANPLHYVSKNAAPFLIFHGDKDPLVPLPQSETFRDAMKKAGVECELVVIKDAGHGGKDFTSTENLKKTEAFFDRHLKKK